MTEDPSPGYMLAEPACSQRSHRDWIQLAVGEEDLRTRPVVEERHTAVPGVVGLAVRPVIILVWGLTLKMCS
jgi:hypothetical protein